MAENCQRGAPGGLGGEFNGPVRVATDPSGNLYVADSSNQRIQKFDTAATFLRAFGKDVDSSQGGTGYEICTVAANCKQGGIGGLGGEYQFPGSVATDAAGNLYVGEDANLRIQKFDSAGKFLRAWGKDVDSSQAGTGFEICTVAANCRRGTAGYLGGEFNNIGGDVRGASIGVATDAADSLYVVDYTNLRVQKFGAGAVDITPPETTITDGPSGPTSDSTPTFTFASSEAGSTFECSVDGAAFAACSSPLTLGPLTEGTHSFQVRARDTAGNVDQSPAERTFTVTPAAPPVTPPVSPPATPTDSPPVTPPDDVVAPAVALAGKKTQKLGITLSLVVKATSEDMWASLSGKVSLPGAARVYKLTGVKNRFVARGSSATLKVKVPKKALAAIKRALRSHKKVKATLRVTVRDAAGNVRIRQRTIKLKL